MCVSLCCPYDFLFHSVVSYIDQPEINISDMPQDSTVFDFLEEVSDSTEEEVSDFSLSCSLSLSLYLSPSLSVSLSFSLSLSPSLHLSVSYDFVFHSVVSYIDQPEINISDMPQECTVCDFTEEKVSGFTEGQVCGVCICICICKCILLLLRLLLLLLLLRLLRLLLSLSPLAHNSI